MICLVLNAVVSHRFMSSTCACFVYPNTTGLKQTNTHIRFISLTSSNIMLCVCSYSVRFQHQVSFTLFMRNYTRRGKHTFMHLADAFIQSRLYIICICVPWELNPQPFALLTQCSTTEPQDLYYVCISYNLGFISEIQARFHRHGLD